MNWLKIHPFTTLHAPEKGLICKKLGVRPSSFGSKTSMYLKLLTLIVAIGLAEKEKREMKMPFKCNFFTQVFNWAS